MIPFYVGQKVTLKDPVPHGWQISAAEVGPEFGVVYTIRSMTTIGLRFHEITNPPIDTSDGFLERAFVARNFRPVVERPTDISIFKKMLNPTDYEKAMFIMNDAIHDALVNDFIRSGRKLKPSKAPI